MGDFGFRAGGGCTSAVSGLGLRTGGRGFREGLLVVCLVFLPVKAARISWGGRGSVRTNRMICITCGEFADSSSLAGLGASGWEAPSRGTTVTCMSTKGLASRATRNASKSSSIVYFRAISAGGGYSYHLQGR